MANAGNLDIGVGVDPSGMIAGFGKSKAEIAKFERAFNSSTRSMGSAFTNMAVDFAASGDVGTRGIKRMAESAVGLAAVFGPGGLLVSAVVGAGITLWNWHDRAREEAKKTEDAYRTLTTTFSLLARTQAVAEFDIDPDRGGKLAEFTRKLEDKQAALNNFLAGAGKGGALANVRARFEADIKAIQDKMKPLEDTRQRLVNLVTDEARGQRDLLTATDLVTARTEARRDAEREAAQWMAEQLRLLDKLSAPSKLPSVWEDLKKPKGGDRGLEGVDVFDSIKRNSDRAKETLKQHAEEWEQTWGRAIDSTTFAFSNFFSNVLSGQVTKFRDFASALLGIWLDMIAQMLAAQATARIFDFLGIGLGAAAGAGGGLPSAPPNIPDIPLPSAVGGGSQVNVNFNISAMDGASVARVLQGAQGEIVRLVAQGMQTSRQATQAIRGGV